MKNKLLNLISDKKLELVSLILLLMWCFSPTVVYLMKELNLNYIIYFRLLICFVGFNGYIIYLISKLKSLYFNKNIKLRQILKKNIPLIAILFILIWALISTIFASDKSLAILGDTYRNEGLIIYFLYVGFILLGSLITNKKYLSYIFKSIILNATIIITIPLFNEEIKDSIFTNYYSSIFSNPNHYGYYLLISTLLTLFIFLQEDSKLKQIIYLITFAYLNYFLIINNTFGCYLALLVTIILLLIYLIITKFKIKKVILILVIFTILSLTTTDIKGDNIAKKNLLSFSSDIETVIEYKTQDVDEKKVTKNKLDKVGTNRMLLWKEAVKVIKKHPVVGIGIENLNTYYNAIGLTQNRPHNIILQVAVFIGIPGAIAYLFLILYLAISNIKYLLKKPDLLMITIYFTFIGYFISSLFGNSMYYTSPYFMILLGMLIYFTKTKKVEHKNI